MPITDKEINASLRSVIDTQEIENKRNLHILEGFGLIAISILLIISIVNFFQESARLVPFTLGMAVAIGLCIIATKLHGRMTWMMHAYGILMILLTIEMIMTGGVSGNGFLWLFILPSVCYLLMRVWLGSIYVLIITITISALFFIPVLAEFSYPYPYIFKFRFMLAFAGVAGMALISEMNRSQVNILFFEALKKVEMLSVRDELTKLLNRRGGKQRLELCHTMAQRNEWTYSLLMVDIDHFKKVNDRYGHDVGDLVLKNASEIFSASIREQDVGVRWGGEEFLFLLPMTDLQGAKIVAESMLTNLRQKVINTPTDTLHITCSIGIAEFQRLESNEQVIARADACLYKAKNMGRDRIEV